MPTVDGKSPERPTNVYERRSPAGAPDTMGMTEPTVVALPDPRLLVVTEPTVVALPDPRLLTYSDHTPSEPTVMAQPRRKQAKPRVDSDDGIGAKTEPFEPVDDLLLEAGARDPRRMPRGSGKRKAKGGASGTVTLGKYQLLRPLASGNTSHVFLARHDSEAGSARHLAIKTLRRQHVYDQTHIAAFHEEARLFGGLHHRGLAQCLDVALSSDGTHYLAMEYLHGETLSAMVQKARANEVGLPLDFSLTAVTSATSALAHAQDRLGGDPRWQHMPHRLIVPSSLTATYDGMVKLTSFGISKASVRAALGAGDPGKLKLGYLTPEHALGKPIDARSDVFALGVVLYELTTLVNPFAAKTLAELKAKVVRGEPALPSQVVPGYPVELEQIVMIALAKSPDERFQDCGALGNALIEVAGTLGMVIGPNAIRGALGKLFGAKIEPWLEPAPAPVAHPDAGLPTAQMPAQQIAAVLTDPAAGAMPRRSHRATPAGSSPPPNAGVSANVVARVSAAMPAQAAPHEAMGAAPSAPSAPAAMTSLPPTSAAPPPPPQLKVGPNAATLSMQAIAGQPSAGAPSAAPVAAASAAPSAAVAAPLAVAPSSRAAVPNPAQMTPSKRAVPPTMPPPLPQAPRPAPSIPLPSLAAGGRKVPPTMPPPLPQAPRPAQLGPLGAATIVEAPAPELLAASAAPAGELPPLQPVLATPAPSVPAVSAAPPQLEIIEELEADESGPAAAPATAPAAPTSLPTLRGHKGSAARVAPRPLPHGQELISTDEIHRIVADAHASAWKDSGRGPAATPPGHDSAEPPRPPAGPSMPGPMSGPMSGPMPPLGHSGAPRVGMNPRHKGATGPEASMQRPLVAAPPASAVLAHDKGRPAMTPRPPGHDVEPARPSWLRRGLEALSVIAALGLLVASQPAMAPVLASLGLDTGWDGREVTAPVEPTVLPVAPGTGTASPAATIATDPTTDPATSATAVGSGGEPASATGTATGTQPATPGTTTIAPVSAPAMYKLVITSDPADATVLLDGERLGRTPISIMRPMSDGTAVLRLRHRGFQTRKIEIKRNQDINLDIKLRPELPQPDAPGDGSDAAPPAAP